ncbi:hypothetical protein M758_UG086700 [Ceratodon purpureus]|nr:hypothetical protein M758_UG086700 [Ceratodon purpureus]
MDRTSDHRSVRLCTQKVVPAHEGQRTEYHFPCTTIIPQILQSGLFTTICSVLYRFFC